MEHVYVLVVTEEQVGLPAPVLESLGLMAGKTVSLTTRERQVIITPVREETIPADTTDTTASFSSDSLVAAYPESGLARLSQVPLKESLTDYTVEESVDGASDTTREEQLPFRKIRMTVSRE